MKRTPFNKSKSIIVDVDGYVGAHLIGGLGNQLFIIAAAYAYSLKYNKACYVSKTWPGMSVSRPSYWTNLLKNIPGIKDLTEYIDYKERDFSYNPIPKYKGNIRIKGYYQSPKYFSSYEDRIRQLFKLPEDIDNYATDYMKQFESKTTVMVHIRRGDYIKLSKTHYVQSINYYKTAKMVMEEKLGFRPTYLYFSDDKQWVRDNFILEEGDRIIDDITKDYEEFAVMRKCNHHIIANSTFSWWAAWLRNPSIGSNKELTPENSHLVIAPLQWFGSKGPSNWQDIYPENWIVLNDTFKNTIEDDNRLHIIHKCWTDDIVINDDMTFYRSGYPNEKGRIFIDNEDIKCIWDKYGVESIGNGFISVKGNIKHLEEKHKQYIKSNISFLRDGKPYNLYLINLEHRTDRKNTFMKDIENYPFNIHHFKAIKNVKGWRGCSLSHLSLVKYAKDNNLPYIIVAEDDALIKVSPDEVFELIKSLESNLDKWEIFNGSPTFGDKITDLQYLKINTSIFNEKLYNVNWGQSTAFMIYNSTSYDKLLNYYYEQAIDQFISNSLKITIYNKPFVIQSASFSDIEKKKQTKDYEDYFISQHKLIFDIINKQSKVKSDSFLGLLSCEKYKSRRDAQDLKDCPMEYKYFIGNPELKEPVESGDIVYLPCKDTYETLTHKTYNMFKWIAANRPYVQYVFKSDDDIKFNFHNMTNILYEVMEEKLDYAGYKVKHKATKSDYHIDKSDLKEKVKVPMTIFCPGGGYIVSKKAIDIIIEKLLDTATIYEDQSVGYCLNQAGIYPVNKKIKRYVCFW